MNSNNKRNYPPQTPPMPKPDTIPYTPYPVAPPRKDNNTNVILGIVLGILVALIIIAAIFGTLIFTGVIQFGDKNNTNSTVHVTPAVEEQSEDDSESGPASVMYIANVPNAVYLRSSPSESDDNIITTIRLATPVSVYPSTENGFSKVAYNGQEGYVKSEYLSYTQPVENKTVIKYMYVANVPNSVYLRSSASENSSSICTIPLGTSVGFIENANSTFSKVNYNGTIGYIKTKYLSDIQPYVSNNTDFMEVYNVPHSIYLRTEPIEDSSNIICEIPVGSTVEYIHSGNGTYYYVYWNGYEGYAKSKYLR